MRVKCGPTASMACAQRYIRAKEDVPGLAMSRSLGDNLAKGIGVTHEPEVVELEI